MEKSRYFIKQYAKDHKWLSELERILNHIDQQSNQCGDTLIECTKSFLEAVFKNIIIKLKPEMDEKTINCCDLGRLSKLAKGVMCEHSFIENVMPMSDIVQYFSTLNQWIRFLGEMRNNIGEISHGKILPKPYSIDIGLAKIISEITDRFAYILLLMLLEIDLSYTLPYKYEDYPGFNDYLDGQYELPNHLIYSRALFEQDYDAYSEGLDNFLDAQAIEIT
ncbi:hypothetical protein [Acinetobacter rudis]|uniref:Abortive infection protein-like C-terminal domain-containing protein n=1 Tax=Acinetobacter rudis CIP 110305 TaxID=421052 RepID=S3MR65_9GAMM|nr:hypothetical protein [Acinetobacter rudis]EPF70370.1 hypothetical protein F945_03393 [Acinetobacter rudis CIP 110305]